MKLTKKKVFVSALALCLVAILSMGTLAWFNASDEVTNNFLIADSNQDNDNLPDFSIEVLENVPGKNGDDDGHTYTNLQPGDELKKELYAENTGMYKQYVRMIVKISDANAWIAANRKYNFVGNSMYIFEHLVDIDTTNWKRFDEPTLVDNELVYVYYYAKPLEKGKETEKLFTKVTIPGALQQADMDFGSSTGFTINAKAEAVQVKNIPVNDTHAYDNAREAFAYVGWTAGADYPQN